MWRVRVGLLLELLAEVLRVAPLFSRSRFVYLSDRVPEWLVRPSRVACAVSVAGLWLGAEKFHDIDVGVEGSSLEL